MEDENLAYFNSLRAPLYTIIERLEIVQPREVFDWVEPTVSLVMRSKDPTNLDRISLSFVGVRNFKFQPNYMPWQVSILEIHSIRVRQWQGLNYTVFNGEQDDEFSFYCFDFSVEFLANASQ